MLLVPAEPQLACRDAADRWFRRGAGAMGHAGPQTTRAYTIAAARARESAGGVLPPADSGGPQLAGAAPGARTGGLPRGSAAGAAPRPAAQPRRMRCRQATPTTPPHALPPGHPHNPAACAAARPPPQPRRMRRPARLTRASRNPAAWAVHSSTTRTSPKPRPTKRHQNPLPAIKRSATPKTIAELHG